MLPEEAARMATGQMVRRVSRRVKPVLRRWFGPDSCINSTRVLVEVFRRLGIEVAPLSCRVRVFSRGFVERANREGGLPTTAEGIAEWLRSPNTYSLGIGWSGIDLKPGHWPGHLALQIGGDCLMDATVDQANRPHYGIILPEVLAKEGVPPEFWDGGRIVVVDSPDGSLLQYKAYPRVNGYLGSPGWNLRPEVEARCAQEIMDVL